MPNSSLQLKATPLRKNSVKKLQDGLQFLSHNGQSSIGVSHILPFWAILVATKTYLLEAVDDAWPGDQVCVGDVGPVSDLVDAVPVLRDHCVANVGKLAVLEDQEGCSQGSKFRRGSFTCQEGEED